MKNAVIYARYSSERQTEQSIDGQLRICEKFALDNGLSIIDTYIDRAVSGRSDKRTAFQKMLKDSSRRTFDYVVVYKLDRFSRNRYDSAMNKAVLKKNGVKLLSAVENITDAPEGIILESMLEGMAEYYSAELAQKVKRGQYESLQKKNFLGGSLPYGYKIENKKYAINDFQSKIVKEIFNDFLRGVMVKDIAKDLNQKGLKNNYGRPFRANTIMNMLKNKKYIGVLEYSNKTIRDFLPAIIDEELFNVVGEIIDRHRRTPAKFKAKESYLLSGKLYCGKCGTLMTAETGTSRNGEIYHYYKCFKRKKDKTSCSKNTIRKDKLESLVLNLTKEHIFSTPVLDKIINEILKIYRKETNDNDLTALIKEKQNTQKALDNLIKALKQGIISNTIQEELFKLENELQNIDYNIKLQEISKKTELTKEKIEFWFSQFSDNNIEDEKVNERIIDSFINKVLLYDNKVVIIYNHTGNNSSSVAINDIDKVCSNLNNLVEHVVPNLNIFVNKNFIVLVYSFNY